MQKNSELQIKLTKLQLNYKKSQLKLKITLIALKLYTRSYFQTKYSQKYSISHSINLKIDKNKKILNFLTRSVVIPSTLHSYRSRNAKNKNHPKYYWMVFTFMITA